VQLKSFDFMSEYQRAVEKMFDDDHAIIAEITKNAPGGALNENELKQLQENKRLFMSMFDRETYEQQQQQQQQSHSSQNQRRLSFDALRATLMIFAYQEQPVFQLPFSLLQSLLDVDEAFTGWRYRHALVRRRKKQKRKHIVTYYHLLPPLPTYRWFNV
jgi:tryptophan 2,3-dioxygenase